MTALTALFVESITTPGRYSDQYGLYLIVRPTGSRGWSQRLCIRGRRRELGLGGYPVVTLDEARGMALKNRKLARSGGDPGALRNRARTIPTFEAAAHAVCVRLCKGWRNRRHHREWMASLRRHVFPALGSVPVSDVSASDVAGVLARIWHERPSTARRLRQRISVVLDWAVAMEYRTNNPCAFLSPLLGPNERRVVHMPAVHHRDASTAIKAVRDSTATRPTKLAFEFLVLTAARSGEVRGAGWAEIDQDKRVWTIPAERTKTCRPHVVPLAWRAVEVLYEAKGLAGGRSKLVFPNRDGNELKDRALSGLLRRLGIAAVPHGFRSTFRDWASEMTSHPRELAEFALGHAIPNKVEAAYARSTLIDRRHDLMEEWADYLVEV